MSRMQNILEKAEREGAVMRLRTPAEPVIIAPPGETSVAAIPALPPLPSPVSAQPISASRAAPVIHTSSPLRLNRSLVAALSTDNAAADQYRGLCTRIMHADQAAAVRMILVTSPGANEGKSTTAANLALTMAREYHKPTCIVDANLRSPRLQHLFGLPDGPGLSDVLAGVVPLEHALTSIENLGLTVLPAGTFLDRPGELLGAPMMRVILDTLRSQFDRVVIDTPAALGRGDMGMLAPLVDRIVLVVRAGVTSKSSIHDVLTTLDATRLLGVVLNEAA
jgi:protein-tyrosine kinase